MDTAVPDWVKPSFVIFDIRALSVIQVATVGVKGLIILPDTEYLA